MIAKYKKFLIYIIAFVSSILTFLFFIFTKGLFIDEKTIVEEIDIYKVAKEEAIKLGRLEPDEKKEIQEMGPDGKVIKPSLSYVDIGGMGNNSNKSFWTNISDTKFFISFDLSFASYEGEDLTDYLTDYDADFRNIVYKEINKISVKDLQVSKGKKLLLNNIKNEFNKYLVAKELEPVVYAALFKVIVINKR
ncbi:flagellar basal body-associated FliL family protein [Alphaproteobacteria bacterium]|nr:flagellar basal body-associated FliL family protein [Alphaproteobacteria bacterium]